MVIPERKSTAKQMVSIPVVTPYLPVRVALLRNYLGPYELPWLQSLQQRVSVLKILASRGNHALLPWATEYDGLQVEMQDRLALGERQAHPSGFTEEAKIHLPRGTLKILRRIHPDVIISSEFGVRTLQALGYSALSKYTPLVVYAAVSERTEMGRGIVRRLLRAFLLKRACAVITPGASGARYLESIGAKSRQIFVVPRTTDMRPFLQLPLARDKNSAMRLFFPGQLIQRKGLLPFLHVLCRWATVHPDRRIECWFLGDGPERWPLETCSKPFNLRLNFLSGVPYDQLPQFYGMAGILAFPTLADEWGMVVNEALASGLPVLGSLHSQAVSELVKDGENGWTFLADRPDESYKAIESALTISSERLMAMRWVARKSVEHITPEFAAELVVQVLRFALETAAEANQRVSQI